MSEKKLKRGRPAQNYTMRERGDIRCGDSTCKCNKDPSYTHATYHILRWRDQAGNRREKSMGETPWSPEKIKAFLVEEKAKENKGERSLQQSTFPPNSPIIKGKGSQVTTNLSPKIQVEEDNKGERFSSDQAFPPKSSVDNVLGERLIEDIISEAKKLKETFENDDVIPSSEMGQERLELDREYITYPNEATQAVAIVPVGLINLLDKSNCLYVGPVDHTSFGGTMLEHSEFCHPEFTSTKTYKNGNVSTKKKMSNKDLVDFTNWFFTQLETDEFREEVLSLRGMILWTCFEGRTNAHVIAEYLNGLDAQSTKKKEQIRVES